MESNKTKIHKKNPMNCKMNKTVKNLQPRGINFDGFA